MNFFLIILNLLLIQVFTLNVWSAAPDARQRLLIDLNWKFIQSEVKGAEEPKFNDSDWRTLNLPHDWSIEGEFREDAITKGPAVPGITDWR
jgi:beta-galactosidase